MVVLTLPSISARRKVVAGNRKPCEQAVGSRMTLTVPVRDTVAVDASFIPLTVNVAVTISGTAKADNQSR